MRSELKGALFGLSAATLFGLSAPLSKLVLPSTGPVLLASLLYLGGGIGLSLVRRAGSKEARLTRHDAPVLAAIILSGGVLGPLLMLFGLQRLSAVAGSLLLNLEGPLTILLAVAVFGEHLGRRAALAAASIFGGALLLGLGPGALQGDWLGVALIAGACFFWALDNNLTQQLSLKDPLATVRIKALGAGSATLLLSFATGQQIPSAPLLLGALALGAASYGISILLDMYALRLLGAAREAAYFATAPFVGALAAIPLLGERLRPLDVVSGAAMAVGVALLVREEHSHLHTHEPIEHDHLHVHDEHHQHAHDGPITEPHAHPHRHAALTHDHPHVSDLHHRHEHRTGS